MRNWIYAVPIIALAAALSTARATETRPAVTVESGIEKGGTVPPYHPIHVSGADRGTNTCPVCKYGALPAVQVWTRSADRKAVGAMARSLDKAIENAGDKKLKAFIVYIRPDGVDAKEAEAALTRLANEDGLKHVALAYVSGPGDPAVRDYKINTAPQVNTTVLVYRDRVVRSRFVNLGGDKKSLAALETAIRQVVQ